MRPPANAPRRRPNHRLVKRYRSYTIEEAARLLGVHRNTVRHWVRQGLQTNDDGHRPTLIVGRHLIAFLVDRRQKRRCPCGPGEIYCLRCRTARRPAGGMADYLPSSAQSGSLMGICPRCEALMYRRVSAAKLPTVCGALAVTTRAVSDT